MAKKYFITVRTNVEGTEYTFKEVDGSKLNKEYFAYKRDVMPKDWIITDLESGVSIKTGLTTLKACKEYLAGLSEEDLAKIDEKKQTSTYKEICQKLLDFKDKTNELDLDFPNPEAE